MRKHLRYGVAADGERVAMEHAVLQQDLHDLRNAACLVEISGDEPSRRLEVTQYRNFRPYPLEIVELQRHPSGPCDRKKVQNSVGGPTDRHSHRYAVLKGPAGEYLPRESLGGDGLAQGRRRC